MVDMSPSTVIALKLSGSARLSVALELGARPPRRRSRRRRASSPSSARSCPRPWRIRPSSLRRRRAAGVVEAILGCVSVVMIARAKSSSAVGARARRPPREPRRGISRDRRDVRSRRSSTARPVRARIRFPRASAAHESRASLIPALPVKQLARSRVGDDRLQPSAPDAAPGDDDRRRLDPVGGEDAGRGDRALGHDHAEVLACRLRCAVRR